MAYNYLGKLDNGRGIFDHHILRYVNTKGFDVFDVEEIEPIHIRDIFSYNLTIRDDASGFPWQSILPTVGDVMRDIISANAIRCFWNQIKLGRTTNFDYISITYNKRRRPGTPTVQLYSEAKEKEEGYDRYPFVLKLMESCFCIPLSKVFKKSNTPLSYDYENSADGTYLVYGDLTDFQLFLYFDFRNFDKNLLGNLLYQAFSLIRIKGINMASSENAHKDTDIRRTYRVWNYLVNYYIKNGIEIDVDGRLIINDSLLSPIVIPIVNWMIMYYVVLKYSVQVQELDIRTFDSVIAIKQLFSVTPLIKGVTSIGLELKILNFSKVVKVPKHIQLVCSSTTDDK